MKMPWWIALVLAVLLGTGLATAPAAPSDTTPSATSLEYLPDGRAMPPKDYRTWPFLTSSLDMNYSDGAAMIDHHIFDNVFVNPEALRIFQTAGTWPDGTILAKEDREGRTHGSINKSGQFQTDNLMGLEFHVKDTKRFKGGWAFFASSGTSPAGQIPTTAACYSCHQSHAAVDTTFVQFYPTLIGIAAAKKTLSAAYIRESSEASPRP
jgi:hypothetical protein